MTAGAIAHALASSGSACLLVGFGSGPENQCSTAATRKRDITHIVCLRPENGTSLISYV